MGEERQFVIGAIIRFGNGNGEGSSLGRDRETEKEKHARVDVLADRAISAVENSRQSQ
jgi:hypothetical protein